MIFSIYPTMIHPLHHPIRLLCREIRKITEKVLNKYPELDKQVFICQKELDYPAQRTASQFNISIESIYKKVSIIMKDLRFQLKLAGYYYSLLTCICFLQLVITQRSRRFLNRIFFPILNFQSNIYTPHSFPTFSEEHKRSVRNIYFCQ